MVGVAPGADEPGAGRLRADGGVRGGDVAAEVTPFAPGLEIFSLSTMLVDATAESTMVVDATAPTPTVDASASWRCEQGREVRGLSPAAKPGIQKSLKLAALALGIIKLGRDILGARKPSVEHPARATRNPPPGENQELEMKPAREHEPSQRIQEPLGGHKKEP